MKFPDTSRACAVLALTALASGFAAADDGGWYLGASGGRTRAKIDDARITSGLLGSGFATTSLVDDDRGTAFKAFGGYQFNRYFALEGGYFDLGKFGFHALTAPAGSFDGRIQLRGVNLDAVGILPITDRFAAFGRVGVNYADARDRFNATGAVRVLDASPSKRDAGLKFGVGLQYAATDALGLRAELERYRVNDAVGNHGDIDMLSVGLVYRFGEKSPVPVAREAGPQPVLVAPAQPAPAPVALAPAMPTRVVFSADSLFDFDRATLKPGGRAALDKFAGDLRGASFDVIHVTGHTDRLGRHAYNLKLSARRAEAVKAYLVEKAGIDATRIAATGVDGAEPVTKPGECVGNKPTPKLVACLQPDRRVDVEVSGTR